MKLLITTLLDNSLKHQLEDLGYEILHQPENRELIGPWPGVEVLVCFKAVAQMKPEDLPDLKFLQLTTTGINQVPVTFQDSDIIISNNYAGYDKPIAEFVLARILEVNKGLRAMDQRQREHLWKKDFQMLELTGSKALILGAGAIAREIGRILKAFGVKSWATSRSGEHREPFEAVVAKEELSELLPQMDYVINALPGTEETRNIVDEAMMKAMAEGSVLINIARGESLDEEALLRYKDKFRAVILDVFAQEPLPKDHPFWDLENFYLSSHTSWISQHVDRRRDELLLENLKRYRQGLTPLYQVDLIRGY